MNCGDEAKHSAAAGGPTRLSRRLEEVPQSRAAGVVF